MLTQYASLQTLTSNEHTHNVTTRIFQLILTKSWSYPGLMMVSLVRLNMREQHGTHE